MTYAQDLERLAYLDADEVTTRRYAPTDSGQVRREYRAEAAAIRARLAPHFPDAILTFPFFGNVYATTKEG